MIRRPLDPWRETFVLHARLHELPGPRIGDALAEIDAHCTDSGQSPQEAFGDPVSYANSLAREGGSSTATVGTANRYARAGLTAFTILGGIHFLLAGVQALAQGSPGVLTVGELVGIAAGTGVVLLIAGLILRPGRRHLTVPLALAFVAGLAAVVAPQLLWEHPVIHAPGGVFLAAGLLLLALGWWPTRAGWLLADRVIDPRTGTDRLAQPRWLDAWLRWGFPASMALFGVLLVVLIVRSTPS